jgi:hypothetical protein
LEAGEATPACGEQGHAAHAESRAVTCFRDLDRACDDSKAQSAMYRRYCSAMDAPKYLCQLEYMARDGCACGECETCAIFCHPRLAAEIVEEELLDVEMVHDGQQAALPKSRHSP